MSFTLMEFPQTKFIVMIYTIYLTYLPAKVCEKAKKCSQNFEIDGIFPNRKPSIGVWHLNHWTKRFAFLTNLMHLVSSKMPESIFMKRFWGLPKWQEETPKRQNRLESVAFGALPPMECGVTDWEPHESEYFVNYGEFCGISWAPCTVAGPSGLL